MPYIDRERREQIKRGDALEVTVAGDYVYWYYYIMMRWWKMYSRFSMAYTIIDSARRATLGFRVKDLPAGLKKHAIMYDQRSLRELAILEFYRQVVGPYEDKKKLENGGVSGE